MAFKLAQETALADVPKAVPGAASPLERPVDSGRASLDWLPNSRLWAGIRVAVVILHRHHLAAVGLHHRVCSIDAAQLVLAMSWATARAVDCHALPFRAP